MGAVDVEDAAAALVTFANGAYGVLETSRVAIGKRVSLQLEVYGSRGSADWDLERPDEFRVCLPGDVTTFGFRRVLVNPWHPGAAELLIAGTDGTSIGWLGQECAMWAEFISAIAEGRPGQRRLLGRRPRQRRHRCAVRRRRERAQNAGRPAGGDRSGELGGAMTTADMDRDRLGAGAGRRTGLAGSDDGVAEAVRPGERRVARWCPGRGPERDSIPVCS